MAYTGHPQQLTAAAGQFEGYKGMHNGFVNELEGHRTDLAVAFKTDVTGPSIQAALTEAHTAGLNLGTKLDAFQAALRGFAGTVASQDNTVTG